MPLFDEILWRWFWCGVQCGCLSVHCSFVSRFDPYIIYYLWYCCWINSLVSAVKERVIRINMFCWKQSVAPTKYHRTHTVVLPFIHYYCFMLFLPFVSLFIFSFFVFISFCCHWILLRLFAALTSLHFLFCCLFSWSHCCTQLAFMFTPDHFLLRFFAPTPNRILFICLMCCCRHTVSHQYHLAIYTHEKTFTAECFNGFSFFYGVNHKGTNRKMMKQKTMILPLLWTKNHP